MPLSSEDILEYLCADNVNLAYITNLMSHRRSEVERLTFRALSKIVSVLLLYMVVAVIVLGLG